MARRADFVTIFYLLGSVVLYLMFIFSFSRHLDDPNFLTLPPVFVGTLAIGIGVGVTIGATITTQNHKSIEKKGEYKYTRKILLYMILSLAALGLIAVYLATLRLEYGYVALHSFLIFAVAGYATELASDLYWEMKHRKIIMSDSKSNRLYAVQK